MKKDDVIIKAHDWLVKFKIDNKLSYGVLADIIDYSAEGVSKAIKNRTLTLQHVQKIASHYKTTIDEFQNIGISGKVTQADIAYVLDNWNEFMEDPLFNAEFKSKAFELAMLRYNEFMKNAKK